MNVCPFCSSSSSTLIYSYLACPVHPYLDLSTPIANYFGDVGIVKCINCNHVYNNMFQESQADNMYQSMTLTNIPINEEMIQSNMSVVNFIKPYLGKNSIAAEIGGGVGLLARALARFVGSIDFYEPSTAINIESFPEENIFLIPGMFKQAKKQYDLVIMKQVLEHIPNFFDVLSEIVKSLTKDGLLYIEVPNLDYILKVSSIVDVHYPHIHYFSSSFLRLVFDMLSLNILKWDYLKNSHDICFLLAKKKLQSAYAVTKATPNRDNLESSIIANNFTTIHDNGIQNLESLADCAFSLYGANAYSQSFLSQFSDYTDNLFAIYDDSPIGLNKCAYNSLGKFNVIAPNKSIEFNEEAIIITAYLHDLHISQKLRQHGFAGKIYTVRSSLDSPALGDFVSIFNPKVHTLIGAS